MIANRKHSFAITAAVFLAAAVLLLLFAGQVRGADPPRITARSAILYDRSTGTVLFEKDADLSRPPASTTKVMTGILTLELASLDEKVEISRNAASTGGASLYLRAGDVFSIRDLLWGALIKSGNDGAVALAEGVAGSEALFADLMNKKAALLGARLTHFTNPNGLPDKLHRSSASDLALITDYALDNPYFAQIVRTRAAVIPLDGSSWKRTLRNTNRMLGLMQGVNGVKTGTTNAAGHCLIASAVRGNQSLITVVLKSGDRYGDTRRLLEYGFNEFTTFFLPGGTAVGHLYFSSGKPYQTELVTARDLTYTVSRDMLASHERKLVVNARTLPLKKGQAVGSFEVHVGGKLQQRIPVVAVQRVEPLTVRDKLGSKFGAVRKGFVDFFEED